MATRPHPPVVGATFWPLMARWGVPVDQALKLIDHAPSASGKRPQFAFTAEQTDRLAMLLEIDQLAAQVFRDAASWLHGPNRSTVFGNRSPIAMMIRDGETAIAFVLQHLRQMNQGRR